MGVATGKAAFGFDHNQKGIHDEKKGEPRAFFTGHDCNGVL